MSKLDTEKDVQHFQYINQRLKYCGMECLLFEDWEIHNPHTDIYNQVFVGPAKYTHFPDSFVYVVIHPGAVYEIDDRDKWSNPKKEDRVPVRKL